MNTEAEPGHLPTAGAPLPAPRVALAVVTAVFLSISLLGFLHVLFLDMGPGEVTLSFGCIVVLLLMQLQWYGRAAARLRSPFGYGVLAAQSLLVYLPILIFGQAWVGMPGFLAGSVLLVLRPVAAWVSFCAIVVSMAAAQLLFTGSLVDIIYRSISTVTTGLTVYGLSRLTALVIEVQSTRAEMARMAVLRERLRFAHDLHDMLDCSLSAITMKIEATQRLIEKCPKEASDQLLETLEISRLALSDARTIAAGYRQVSLEDECRSAVSLLQAADIGVRLDSRTTDLPMRVSTVLAVVLRMCVTHLLRHSKTKHCDITIRQTRDRATLEIVNDDMQPHSEESVDCSRTLHDLSVRAGEIGGSVSLAHEPKKYRLRVDVPLSVERSLPKTLR